MSTKKISEGTLLEIECIDHTSDDSAQGWREAPEILKQSKPEPIRVVGYLVGETKHTYVLSMAKDLRARAQFSTLFHVVKGTVTKIRKA